MKNVVYYSKRGPNCFTLALKIKMRFGDQSYFFTSEIIYKPINTQINNLKNKSW